MELDSLRNKIYAAINYPGIISQISEIDIYTSKIRKIATLDSPQMYYSTNITLDKENQKIYITEQNNKYRNLVEIDIITGRKKVMNKITRTGDLVFNKKDRSIWGIQHDNGYAKLVKMPYPYTTVIPIYTTTFGRSIFDLSISNSCEKLLATLSGIKVEQSLIMFDIKTLEEGDFGFGLNTYGDLEVIPQYQNITTNVKRLQTAYITYGKSKLRKTLGGIQDETGYNWNATASSYYVNNQLFPSIVSNQEAGFLIPNIRNTSLWIRNSIGQIKGNRQSVFSNFYFGGFGNNLIDWQPSEQYRNALSFPGAEINEIPARNYIKTLGELNLKPLRLRNIGTTWLYPTYIKTSLFSTHLLTNVFENNLRQNYFNIGFQTDIQLVLFSYLKTTWSVGYARKYESTTSDNGRWMLSLKLLGD